MAAPDQLPKITDPLATREPSIHGSSPMANGVRYGYRGEDVVATLDRVCRTAGYPKTIRVEQGSEFVSRDMDLWACQRGGVLDFSRPGKPTDNALTSTGS